MFVCIFMSHKNYLYSTINLFLTWKGASLVVQVVKNLPAMWETWFNPWVGKISWRRERLPTPVFLPGESHGQRSLRGYGSWSCKELDTKTLSVAILSGFLIVLPLQPHLLALSDSDFILQPLKLLKNFSHITLPSRPRLHLCWSLSWNVSPRFLAIPTFHLYPDNSWSLLILCQLSLSATFHAPPFPCHWMVAAPLCIPGSLGLALSAHSPPSFTISLWVCGETLSSMRAGSALFVWLLATPGLTQRHTDYCKVSKCLLLSVQSATLLTCSLAYLWNHCGFFSLSSVIWTCTSHLFHLVVMSL